MSPKFFYAYLIGATVALLLASYRLLIVYHEVSFGVALLYFIPALLLYYMAYKVYHIKNDNELM
jgi:4-amino-4-deoxy-L-arabinose transferase-like glycosyltransferase